MDFLFDLSKQTLNIWQNKSPSIWAIAAAIGLRILRLLVTFSQNTSSSRILLMALSMAADWDMAISCRDSFPSSRLSYMMTTPPHRVMLGSFSGVILLWEVDCWSYLFALHICPHLFRSLVQCVHCLQCHDILKEKTKSMGSVAHRWYVRVGLLHFCPSSLHVRSIVSYKCENLLRSKVIDDIFQLISNVGACVSVVLCVCALIGYWWRGGDDVVDNSLSRTFDHPSEMTAMQSALLQWLAWPLLALCWTLGGVYAERITFRNLYQ